MATTMNTALGATAQRAGGSRAGAQSRLAWDRGGPAIAHECDDRLCSPGTGFAEHHDWIDRGNGKRWQASGILNSPSVRDRMRDSVARHRGIVTAPALDSQIFRVRQNPEMSLR